MIEDMRIPGMSEKAACKLTVDILALAYGRGCEAELATLIAELLAEGALATSQPNAVLLTENHHELLVRLRMPG